MLQYDGTDGRLRRACTRGNLLRWTWGSCAKPCEHCNAKDLFLTGPRKFGACCFFLQSIAIEAHLCRLSFMAKLRLVFCTHWCKHGHHNVCLLCGTFHARLNWTSATTSLFVVGSGSFICCVLSEKLTLISCRREQCQDMHTMLAVSFATGVVSKQSHSNAALIGASSMRPIPVYVHNLVSGMREYTRGSHGPFTVPVCVPLAVEEWHVACKALPHGAALLATDPVSGQRCDTSLNIFGDDDAKTHAIPTVPEFAPIVTRMDADLDRSLQGLGMAQNHDKKELLVPLM